MENLKTEIDYCHRKMTQNLEGYQLSFTRLLNCYLITFPNQSISLFKGGIANIDFYQFVQSNIQQVSEEA